MLWESQPDIPWHRAVHWAQAALATIGRGGSRPAHSARQPGPSAQHPGRPAPRPGKPLEERVSGIVRGLARRLEADLRARSRRTRHADRRHEAGDRPTRKALDDILKARTSAAYLFDERTGALVIVGERGRTHFFTPDGRLVSSVRYSRDAIERKRKTGVWRAASESEAQRFREQILRRGARETVSVQPL